jgi:hypothetical protein
VYLDLSVKPLVRRTLHPDVYENGSTTQTPVYRLWQQLMNLCFRLGKQKIEKIDKFEKANCGAQVKEKSMNQ